MVIRTSVATLVAGLLLALVAHPAGAQSLQRLHVQSFTLSSDTTHVQIDVPFHLVVTLRMRERVTEIQNLELPMLAQLELLGDVRQTSSGPNGTQYRETITMVAHNPGDYVISPATLQAIDARDGKPKEWFTNSFMLHVGGNATRAFNDTARGLASAAWMAVRISLWIVGFGFVAVLVALLVRRRPPAPAPVPVAEPVEPPIVRTARQRVEDALTVLRAEPTRPTAVRVRTAIWEMNGASEGETLGDVLRRAPSNGVAARDVLIALERSAFTYDADLKAAIEDACAALARYAEVLT